MSRVVALTMLAALAACGEDEDADQVPFKTAVDAPKLQAGVTVPVVGNVGTVNVPLLRPVPAVADVAVQAALDGKIVLLVKSPRSGLTANLTTGKFVDRPSDIGEYTWRLSVDRKTVTVTFFNGTTSGLRLSPGREYLVEFTLNANDYIETLPAVSFVANVQ